MLCIFAYIYSLKHFFTMKDIITKEAFFNSNIDTVWSAITQQDEISKWFLKADFKAEEGYNYSFQSPDDNCAPIIGTVIKADPFTLIYTWIIKGTDIETTVKWQLETANNGTKLNLTHSGIANYKEENVIKMFESFSGGWDNCIEGLTTYL